MSETIFLSTVSKEFGPLRQRLALLLQRTKAVTAAISPAYQYGTGFENRTTPGRPR